MKKLNCDYKTLDKMIAEKRIIVYGVGDYFQLNMREICSEKFMHNISYFVDKGKSQGELCVNGRMVAIKNPEELADERNCVIVLASPNFMCEMYQTLEKMDLDDSVECVAFPLVMAVSKGAVPLELEKKIFDGEGQIDKVIHCFWFSGDKKPQEYQKCVDSWKRVCPDYEIKEWTMDNYDYSRHPFVEKAIKLKRWASASDYARLDVVYQYGGIYMDMDMEVLKPLDRLLGNKAFFSFDVCGNIDLGMFASVRENELLQKFMSLYDKFEFGEYMHDVTTFAQPRYIQGVVKEAGVHLNGDMQYIDEMAFLPRQYLMPKDFYVYELLKDNENAFAIHHYNTGWGGDDFRVQRMVNNRKLLNIFSGEI